jgi:hypothetical protein
VVGTFIGAFGCHIVANPFLQRAHLLRTWTPGLDVIQSQVVNNFDFWLSFGIGTSIVVALVGIGSVISALVKRKQSRESGTAPMRFAPPPGRGDIRILPCVTIWFRIFT